MVIILNLDESTLSLKILDDSFSRLVSVHAGVFRIVVDYLCVIGQDIDNGQVMAQTDLEVIRVMRGSYLNDTGSEVYLASPAVAAASAIAGRLVDPETVLGGKA